MKIGPYVAAGPLPRLARAPARSHSQNPQPTHNQPINNQSKQDVNATNAQGNTPLHWACLNGQQPCAERLLEAGAAATVLNRAGRTAVDEALGRAEGGEALLALINRFESAGVALERAAGGEAEDDDEQAAAAAAGGAAQEEECEDEEVEEADDDDVGASKKDQAAAAGAGGQAAPKAAAAASGRAGADVAMGEA